MKFAQDTSVPVERSRSEIEATVNRYGATAFMSGYMGNLAQVAFEMRERQLRFILPLPDKQAKEFTHGRQNQHGALVPRKPDVAYKAWEQACRQRWRALLLAIKAKLEAVECGISTFDSEFMAQIVLPNGRTVGEMILPDLGPAITHGRMPALLPALPA